MFRYCLVHASEHPSLAQGRPWPGLLSTREEAILAHLGMPARRRKWLMGRAAAKRLVREEFGEDAVPENQISILNQPSNEPFVLFEGRGAWDRPISISHRSEIAMAAAPTKSARIGADLETVEPREPALVRQFYADSEARLVETSRDNRDEVVARIWSAKEAVLKLLGLGLRMDTRSVLVSFAAEPAVDCPVGWQPIDVRILAELPRRETIGTMRVVWRREPDCVLTVAVAG